MEFLNHIPCGYKIVVDHINNISTDNRIDNLQLITSRENIIKDSIRGKSKYPGVDYDKVNKKWRARLEFNGDRYWLGRFINEIDAHNAIENKLKEITN